MFYIIAYRSAIFRVDASSIIYTNYYRNEGRNGGNWVNEFVLPLK
jgi:hypothetical protein